MECNHDCNLCTLSTCHGAQRKCVWGAGSPKAKLMLIGEAPDQMGQIMMQPCAGPAEDLLNHVLTRLGIDRASLYVTNVLKCRPDNGKLPGAKELRECLEKCRPYLQEELKTVKPKAVLVLGGTALKMYTGLSPITKYEGMEVSPQVFAGFSPSYVLHSPSKEIRLAQAIARAAQVADIKIKPTTGDMFPYEIRT